MVEKTPKSDLMPKSTFGRRHTQVKINPETYIRFDGTKELLLSNVYSDGQALQIQSDIMLILWDITEWKSLGEIMDSWPDPIDHPKIVDHLYNLYTIQVVIVESEQTEGAKPAAPSAGTIEQGGIASNLHKNLHFNTDNHVTMLGDHIRLSSYRRAIERSVGPESVVMDLGCGTGVLGFFAAKAGAKKVYAIEKRQDILALASEIGRRSGVENVDFVFGASSQLEPERFDPQPNILVAEILGNQILEEHVLEFTMDARDRLLAPNATLIPYKLGIDVFAFESKRVPQRGARVHAYSELYNLDFSPLADIVDAKHMRHTMRYNPQLDAPLSKPITIKELDLRTLDNPIFSAEFDMTVTQDGHFGGYCAYFNAWLDEETILTNSPWAPETHWTQLVHMLPQPVMVKEGDVIKMDVVYDGILRFQLKDIKH